MIRAADGRWEGVSEVTADRAPARVWPHVAALALLALLVLALLPLRSPWNSDDGAYAAAVHAVRDQRRWDVPYRYRSIDPGFHNFPLTLSTKGGIAESASGFVFRARVPRPQELESATIKSGPDGQAVPLRNIAQIELVPAPEAVTGLDGRAAAFVLVSRLPDADPSAVHLGLLLRDGRGPGRLRVHGHRCLVLASC